MIVFPKVLNYSCKDFSVIYAPPPHAKPTNQSSKSLLYDQTLSESLY